MRFRFMIAAGLAALTLVGCAGRSDAPWPNDSAMISAAYDAIDEQYVSAADFSALTVDGLKGLSRVDSSVRIESNADQVQIFRQSEIIYQAQIPTKTSAAFWAQLAEDALAAVSDASPAVRHKTREERYQIFMDGALADLDRFTHYSNARRAEVERGMREGYGGIGLSFEAKPDFLLVQRVFTGSPAAVAGMQEGDHILAVDDRSIAGLSAEGARDRMIGPIGTQVVLTVSHADLPSRRVAITRRLIYPQTIMSRRINDTLVIAIDRFSADTAQDLRQAINRAEKTGGFRRLLIDLRGNPGGLVDQGVEAADLFLSAGLIARAEGRASDAKQRWDADSRQRLAGIPIRLLIDGGTASAAEIMAAGLIENHRATAIGTDSFGKGVIQNVLNMPNGGVLYLTWANLFTPSGRGLHQLGIRPTICLDQAGRTKPLPAEPPAPNMIGEGQISRWRSACPPERLLGDKILSAAVAGEW